MIIATNLKSCFAVAHSSRGSLDSSQNKANIIAGTRSKRIKSARRPQRANNVRVLCSILLVSPRVGRSKICPRGEVGASIFNAEY